MKTKVSGYVEKYLIVYTLAEEQGFRLHQKNPSELEASVQELPAESSNKQI